MVRKTKAQKANFFVKFWNGDLSLPMSYWGVGLGLGLVFGFSVGFFTILLGMSEDAMWGFLIPFQIYTVVGIWRSSDKYKGKKIWAALAKIAVIIGIISNLFSMVTGV
jgi:hypothetical protein